jgi:hypothetical protein
MTKEHCVSLRTSTGKIQCMHYSNDPSDFRIEKACPSSVVLTAAYVKFCIHQRKLHVGALYTVEVDRQVLWQFSPRRDGHNSVGAFENMREILGTSSGKLR